jgi:hypothetical protein
VLVERKAGCCSWSLFLPLNERTAKRHRISDADMLRPVAVARLYLKKLPKKKKIISE